MYLVTAEEMRRIDETAITKYNIPSLTLMERAGAGLRIVLKRGTTRILLFVDPSTFPMKLQISWR